MRFPPLLPALLFALLLASPAHAKPEAVPVPPGYLRQALEPTGGEIARPIDWFFRSDETPSGWLWTLSKEDPSKGPYLTGQRIQLMVGVEASSGLTRAAFARQYLDERRKGARVVVHGEGLAFAKHAGQPVVRLTLVSHIEHEAAPAFHEPQPAAIAA